MTMNYEQEILNLQQSLARLTEQLGSYQAEPEPKELEPEEPKRKGRPGGNPELQKHQFKPLDETRGVMRQKISIRLPDESVAKYKALTKEQREEIREKLIEWIDNPPIA